MLRKFVSLALALALGAAPAGWAAAGEAPAEAPAQAPAQEAPLRADLTEVAINVLNATAGEEHQYNNTNQFDFNLRASMARNIPVITVLLDGEVTGTRTESGRFRFSFGERLGRWIYKVRDTRGRTWICTVEDQQGVFSFLVAAFTHLFPFVRTWLMYRPARNYDAIAYVRSAGEGAAATHTVERIEFRYRWTDESRAERTPDPCAPLQRTM